MLEGNKHYFEESTDDRQGRNTASFRQVKETLNADNRGSCPCSITDTQSDLFYKPPLFTTSSTATDVGGLLNQGIHAQQQGLFSQASQFYQKVIDINPGFPDVWYLQATISLKQADFGTALQYINQAFELCHGKPPHAGWLLVYGHIFRGLKRLENASVAFENASKLAPHLPDAWWGLAITRYELGRPSQQIENALVPLFELDPNHLEAILLLAKLRQRQRRPAEATALYRKANELKPGNQSIQEYLARSLHADNKHYEALEILESFSETEKENSDLLHLLGVLYGETGKFDQSKKCFQKASKLTGNLILRWKHLWFCPSFFESAEEIDDYWSKLNEELDAALEEALVFDWRKLPYDGFTSSFHLPHHNRCCREAKEKFCALFEKSFSFQRPQIRYQHRANGKIRVGFLVTPGHEGGFFRMTQGIMKGLDRQRFEVFLFYHQDFSGRFQALKQDDINHKPYNWDFEQSVQILRKTCCDVMFYRKVSADLWSTFFPMTYLAPIQCTSWGTLGTSGIHHIDYYISWDAAEIPEAQEHYTEKLFFLKTPPNTSNVEPRPKNTSRASLGLPKDGALYFCPHRVSKYHSDFDFYLRDILAKDSSGHILLLLGPPSKATDKLKARMRQNIGLNLFRRVIFLARMVPHLYYQFLSSSTVVLDSPYYASEQTCFDAFSVDVPCVTQIGNLLMQRYSATRYAYLGIEGPVASSQQEYVDYAVRIGTDKDYRDQLVTQIRENYGSMVEQEPMVREYERFFEYAVDKHLADHGIDFVNVKPTKESKVEPRVDMIDLEVNLTYGCNQKCKYCSHFCAYDSGYEPEENILSWYETWNSKVRPQNIRLIGGEPLLHPNIESLIRKTDQLWPDSRVNLVTNGKLLTIIDENTMNSLRDVDAHVFVSCHYNDPEYLAGFRSGLDRLIQFGISHSVYTSFRDWRKIYHIESDGRLLPFKSDPEKAWNNCIVKNACPALMGNAIYKCQYLAHVIRNRSTRLLGEEWRIADEYHPLTKEFSHESIVEHLNSSWIPQCSLCAEHFELVSLDEKREL